MNNLAWHIRELSRLQPDKKALLVRNRQGSFDAMTFAELDKRSEQLAWGMSNAGMRPGMKSIFMAKPSLELYALYFAVLKLGAVPVLLPQWRGWNYALTCIMQCAPRAFIGTPSSFFKKIFFGRAFSSVDVNIMIGRFQLFGGIPSGKLKTSQDEYPIHDFGDEEKETIIFSAGSTGAPKGAIQTHDMLERRMTNLKELFPKQTDAPDMSCQIACTLFELCLGHTMLVANDEPQEILDAANGMELEYAFANTSTWYGIAELCRRQQARLKGLKEAVILGTPGLSSLSNALLRHALMPETDIMQTYSTSETGIVSLIKAQDMLEISRNKENLGKGLCLGQPLKSHDLKTIRHPLENIENLGEDMFQQDDAFGEITTLRNGKSDIYLNRPDESKSSCMECPDGCRFRTGDLGFIDKEGMLWYMGRIQGIVETASGKILYPARCEEIANAFPGVKRSLLVGIGDRPKQIPVLIVEPEAAEYEKLADNRESLLQHLAAFPQTAEIKYLLLKHEIIDDMEQNTQWAAGRI